MMLIPEAQEPAGSTDGSYSAAVSTGICLTLVAVTIAAVGMDMGAKKKCDEARRAFTLIDRSDAYEVLKKAEVCR